MLGLSSDNVLDATSCCPPVPVAPAKTPATPARFVMPTSEQISAEIEHVLGKQLSKPLQHWVERYSKVGRRTPYLWTWARQGVEVTTLPCVDIALYDEVCDTKVLGVILDTLLDDVADQQGNGALLERLLQLPFDDSARLSGPKTSPEDDYVAFTYEVWEEIKRRVRSLPRYEQYAQLLRYDYLQLFNVMRFSVLVNEDVALLNLAEHDLYTPHNMHIMISATMDLMCSPSFDRREVGTLRDAVWHAQCMGRIGNLVTTWERELGEGDFTSGVYASALAAGDITVDQLEGNELSGVAAAIRAGGHEELFLERWAQCRQRLVDLRPRVKSIDLGKLLTGYERLICLHLGSRGYK